MTTKQKPIKETSSFKKFTIIFVLSIIVISILSCLLSIYPIDLSSLLNNDNKDKINIDTTWTDTLGNTFIIYTVFSDGDTTKITVIND
jgi:hypothetical protein